jgi:FixJ family two-component response regulator
VGDDDRRLVSIVDDDESLRRSVRNLLTSVGFPVETFSSADAFLQSPHQEQTGCLVLDLRMPGMTGLDLLAHLAATGSRIPAVILTAHGDDEARRRALQAGAVAFLGKPFRGDLLLDAVRTALGQGGSRT